LPGQALFVERDRLRVIALDERHRAEVVERLGDAQRVAQLPVERQTLLVQPLRRRIVPLPVGQNAGAPQCLPPGLTRRAGTPRSPRAAPTRTPGSSPASRTGTRRPRPRFPGAPGSCPRARPAPRAPPAPGRPPGCRPPRPPRTSPHPQRRSAAETAAAPRARA